MIKTIPQLKKQLCSKEQRRSQEIAEAREAVQKVRTRIRQGNQSQKTKAIIMKSINNGLAWADETWNTTDEKNIFNGALLYALRHSMENEISQLILVADVNQVSLFLAGRFKEVGDRAKPEQLDLLGSLVSLKQAKKMVRHCPELDLPRTKVRLVKADLAESLPTGQRTATRIRL